MIASSMVLLAGDILQVVNHDNILWTICLAISFVLFAGGIPAVNSLICDTNKRLRLLIIILLLIGAIAGASMQVLFRTLIILRNANFTDAIETLSNNTALSVTTMVPGIFFPLGLILLCFALFFAKTYPTWKIILLLIGAVSFPVGHAMGNLIALVAGDLILISAWLMFSTELQPEERKITPGHEFFSLGACIEILGATCL